MLLSPGLWLLIVTQSQASLTQEQAKGLHALFDRDGNGKASMAEVINWWSGSRTDHAKKNVPAVIEDMDWDKDGVISLYEVLSDEVWKQFDPESQVLKDQKASEEKKFKASDKNGDGLLDENEVISFFFPGTHDSVLQILAERLIEIKDTDADGKLTAAEFEAEQGDHFDKLDTDHSGKLDVSELKVWESGQFKIEEAMKTFFVHADADGDGHISATELDEATSLGHKAETAAEDALTHLKTWAEDNEL